jgi:hypothetical protein
MFRTVKFCRQNRRWLLQAALLSSVALAVFADVPSSPYDPIVSRNPFGLKPPPPPPPPDESANTPPPAPLADVTLTGITSILGNNRALFEIIPAPGKPAIKPILGEGERVENIEVVAINLDKNEVTIKNGTVLTNLTFKVAKSAPTVPPPPLGLGQPAIVNPIVPNPQQTTAAPTESGGRRSVMVAGGSGATTAPLAPVANPAANPAAFRSGVASPPVPGFSPAPNLNSGLRSIPQRAIRPSPQAQQLAEPQTPEQRETSRALQYLQMRASEEQAKQRGMVHPPTPPIPGME